MSLKTTEDRIGDRIRYRRHELGLTLTTTADLAGINKSTLSRIEAGTRSANNRFVLVNIAQALKCPVDHLTGVVAPGADASASTYDTVRALLTADLEFTPTIGVPPAPIEVLAARAQTAVDLRQACDYTTLTQLLPALVRDLYEATTGPDRDPALRWLVRVAEAASFAVRFTGQPAAASICADRARQAAELLGDPVMVGFGAWARAHAALGCGLHDRAAQITQAAIRGLENTPAGVGRPEMLGMLYLTTAFALVGAGRAADADAALAHARELAEHTGETTTLALMFGPTNVRLWELAILTDGGDPTDAVPIITGTNPHVINSPSRQGAFYADAGRAYARLGRVDEAVRMIEESERLTPQRVHGDPIMVETIRELLDLTHRRAAGVRLRGLARRTGASK